MLQDSEEREEGETSLTDEDEAPKALPPLPSLKVKKDDTPPSASSDPPHSVSLQSNPSVKPLVANNRSGSGLDFPSPSIMPGIQTDKFSNENPVTSQSVSCPSNGEGKSILENDIPVSNIVCDPTPDLQTLTSSSPPVPNPVTSDFSISPTRRLSSASSSSGGVLWQKDEFDEDEEPLLHEDSGEEKLGIRKRDGIESGEIEYSYVDDDDDDYYDDNNDDINYGSGGDNRRHNSKRYLPRKRQRLLLTPEHIGSYGGDAAQDGGGVGAQRRNLKGNRGDEGKQRCGREHQNNNVITGSDVESVIRSESSHDSVELDSSSSYRHQSPQSKSRSPSSGTTQGDGGGRGDGFWRDSSRETDKRRERDRSDYGRNNPDVSESGVASRSRDRQTTSRSPLESHPPHSNGIWDSETDQETSTGDGPSISRKRGKYEVSNNSSDPRSKSDTRRTMNRTSLGGSRPSTGTLKFLSTDPLLEGCRAVSNFKRLNKISEGTYGAVYRAVDLRTKEILALKHVKYHEKIWDEGFPLTSLREISILLELKHDNIINVREVVVGSSPNQVFMVMEYVEHEVKCILEQNKPQFSAAERKSLLQQLLKAVEYMHRNWVIHRDLKTSNILYSNKGVLKVCDFGMARKFGEPLKPYTHNVVTLWYRAPELLFGQKIYSQAVDLWSVGCIFGEIILGQALFSGRNEKETLDKIFSLCGTPTDASWPELSSLPSVKNYNLEFMRHKPSWRQTFPSPKTHYSNVHSLTDQGLDLLSRLLTLDPKKRITAKEALKHPFFFEKPYPQEEKFMPTIPDTNATVRTPRKPEQSLNENEIKNRNLFHDIESRYTFGSRIDPTKYLLEMEVVSQKIQKQKLGVVPEAQKSSSKGATESSNQITSGQNGSVEEKSWSSAAVGEAIGKADTRLGSGFG